MSVRPLVLFVCRHNTGRSQMAEAYLRTPNASVVAAMQEDGFDISDAVPKLIDQAIASRAMRIVTMGCDVREVQRIDADWGLPDPKDQSRERVREIRDLVREKATALAQELRRELCLSRSTVID